MTKDSKWDGIMYPRGRVLNFRAEIKALRESGGIDDETVRSLLIRHWPKVFDIDGIDPIRNYRIGEVIPVFDSFCAYLSNRTECSHYKQLSLF